MLSVMCCGCLRLLGKNGELLGDPSKDGGLVDISAICKRFAEMKETAAAFSTKQEADGTATSYGWQVWYEKGKANHRCPNCQESPTERIGAFFDWETNCLLVERDQPDVQNISE
jgi:predicted RNA-binding Zn-ribbon protein involved in translation (DUF1610 family)